MINFHKVITSLVSFIHGTPRSRVPESMETNIVSIIILPCPAIIQIPDLVRVYV